MSGGHRSGGADSPAANLRMAATAPDDVVSMAESGRHPHVFHDPTGRRWNRVRLALALGLLLLLAMAAVSWQRVQDPPTLAGGQTLPPPATVSDIAEDPPVIGAGPLVRVVRVDRPAGEPAVAVDPFTNEVLRQITGEDAATVGTSEYALDRYGYSSAASKTISLTFDDGPDPTWTREILDVLHKHGVPATFFPIASEAVRHPELMKRIVDEGHAVGNHTFTHPVLTRANTRQELVTADRVVRATTGAQTSLFRMPFNGDYAPGGAHRAEALNAMLEAQRLGYLISLDDFDTNDWKYGDGRTRPQSSMPLPRATSDNITVLLHDGGGNRAETVEYLDRIIEWGRANGYTFHSLPQVSQEVADGTSRGPSSLWDYLVYYSYRAVWFWPGRLLQGLFLLAVVSVAAGGLLNVSLALVRRARVRRRFAAVPDQHSGPPVSVVIAAFNEDKVIEKTLASVVGSRYRDLVEVIVVDDGSTDRTAEVVNAASRRDSRIRLIHQANAGKATALNRGFHHARGDVVVSLDADTIFTPDTVTNLVRHFTFDETGRLGAACGMIKVGNLRNLLSRWQGLEYVTQVGVERSAQDVLQGIMVIPGACAAWRRDAVLLAGGYSHSTLTEDCDMALTLQQRGYRVVQDDEAVGLTEVPEGVRALAKQRFRWLYGNVQALWKHRSMILNPRYGWLGMLTMPLAVLSVLLPIVFMPFVYAMAVITLQGQGLSLILLYVGLFIGVQLIMAAAGVWLTRERPVHLLMVPLYRVIYEPLRAYLLYRALFSVMRGVRHDWNKVQRTGTVTVPVRESPTKLAS